MQHLIGGTCSSGALGTAGLIHGCEASASRDLVLDLGGMSLASLVVVPQRVLQKKKKTPAE